MSRKFSLETFDEDSPLDEKNKKDLIKNFAEGAKSHSFCKQKTHPWDNEDKDAKPTYNLRLQFNTYQKLKLKHLASLENRGLNNFVKNIVLERLEKDQK